jgi:hypothetical protein
MSYGKNESNKKETIEKNRKQERKKIPCAHGDGGGHRKRRGVEIRNVDT